MRLNESNYEASEQEYVCPFCLRNMEKGIRCACNVPGTIRTPEQTVQARIERLTERNRHKVLEIIQLLEDRETKDKEMEPKAITTLTTPHSATGSETDTDNSLSDHDVVRADAFALLQYGLRRMGMHWMIDDAICALQATRERLRNDTKTECLLLCIEAKLKEAYDELEENQREVLSAFNACFPENEISI